MDLVKKFLSSPLTLFSAFLLTVVLRLPSLFDPYWYVDEGVYLTGGQIIRRGLTLYRDLYDNKPPLIHYVAALTPSQFWFHFLGIILSLVTLYLFYRLSLRFFKSGWLTTLAVLLFAVVWNPPYVEGHTVNAEHFFVPLGMLAFLLLWGREKPAIGRFFGSGLLLGLGFLFKFHSIFDLAALLVFWLMVASASSWKELLRRSFFLILGFVTPLLLSIVYFFSQGVLWEYLRAAFLDNFVYAGRWQLPAVGWWAAWGPANVKGRLLLLVFFSALLYFWRQKISRSTLFLSLWFLFTLFGALLSSRNYPHYLLPILPPLFFLLWTAAVGRGRERIVGLAALVLTISSLLFFQYYFYPSLRYYRDFWPYLTGRKEWLSYAQSNFGWTVARNYQIADYIKKHTQPNDRIFLLTDQPHLYALSERVPAVPYLFLFQIKDLGKEEEVINRLRQNPPKIMVTFQDEPRTLPGFEGFLLNNYQPSAAVNNAVVYVR